MARRDLYEVLGVPRTATPEEIRQAYRRLARQYHPDMNQADPKAAEEKFKELSEAYEVLADPERRRRYDANGFSAVDQEFGPQGFTWQNFTHASDLEDLFGSNPLLGQLFGSFFGGGPPFGPGGGPRHMEVALRIPLDRVLTGGTGTIDLPREDPCLSCRGTGARGGTAMETCSRCQGQGRVQQVLRQGRSQFLTVTVCPVCHGAGRRILERCPECRGSGRVRGTRRIEIQIPAGVEDGTRLRLQGQGLLSPDGGPPGDLFVRIEVEEDPRFRREGRDLFTEVLVPVSVAIVGGEVRVNGLAGEVLSVKIPAGTQPGEEFRLRGHGLPRMGGGARGDLYAVARVQIPRSLSSRQRELVQEALGPSAERKSSLFGRRG
ncbi:MAG: molecular chaperone DnaJ [Thermoplasmata archaeon]